GGSQSQGLLARQGAIVPDGALTSFTSPWAGISRPVGPEMSIPPFRTSCKRGFYVARLKPNGLPDTSLGSASDSQRPQFAAESRCATPGIVHRHTISPPQRGGRGVCGPVGTGGRGAACGWQSQGLLARQCAIVADGALT